jgi:ABC-type glycerol-3-phosphate transport system substrate-binding protein
MGYIAYHHELDDNKDIMKCSLYSATSCVLLLCMLLSSCALATPPSPPLASSAQDADVTTIGFASVSSLRPRYDPLITRFNSDNPDIQVQFVALDELDSGTATEPQTRDQQLRQQFGAADSVDLTFFDPTESQPYLLDLAPLMDADPDFDRGDFYPRAFGNTSQSAQYVLPHTVLMPLLAYNQELWAASGLPRPTPNWDWNDLTTAAETLAVQRGGVVERYGLLQGRTLTAVMMAELEARDSELLSATTEDLQLDTAEIAAALERTVALVEAGAVYVPFDHGADAVDPLQLIIDQQVGLWPSADFQELTSGTALDFTVGKIPCPPSAYFWPSGVLGYGISRGAQHPESTWRWIAYLSQQQIDLAIEELDPASLIPARRAAAEQSGYWSMLDAVTSPVIEQALTQPAPPLHSGRLGQRVSVWNPLDDALDAVLDGAEVEAALAQAQANLEIQIAAVVQTPEPTPDSRPLIVELPIVSQAPDGATTIRFAPAWMDSRTLLPIVERFNQSQTDIFVELLEPIDFGTEVFDTYDEAAVDCFQHFGQLAPATMPRTLDLQPLIEADPNIDVDDYPPALFALYRNGEALHGLPYAVKFNTLNYNRTAFETAGVAPPTIDWTLNDFVDAAQELTRGTGPTQRYGYAAPAFHTPDIQFFLDRAGVSLVDQREDGALAMRLTDPTAVAVMHTYLDLLHNTSPHTEIYGYRQGVPNSLDANNLIFAGQVGMWLTTDFSGAFGVEALPELTISLAPLPLGDSRLTVNDFEVRGLHIVAATLHPQACWSWINYLSSEAALLHSRVFPVRTSVATSDTSVSRSQMSLELRAIYQRYIDLLNQQPVTAASEPEAKDYFWFYQALDNALQGGDLKAELEVAQRTTDAYLAWVHDGDAPGACARQVDPAYAGFAPVEE